LGKYPAMRGSLLLVAASRSESLYGRAGIVGHGRHALVPMVGRNSWREGEKLRSDDTYAKEKQEYGDTDSDTLPIPKQHC
jgi:hypothetical protein